jgi:hypothetical protein
MHEVFDGEEQAVLAMMLAGIPRWACRQPG